MRPVGEQPDCPSFPTRPLFAAGGLGVGLGLGLLIAICLEFSDKSIRTEQDAADRHGSAAADFRAVAGRTRRAGRRIRQRQWQRAPVLGPHAETKNDEKVGV